MQRRLKLCLALYTALCLMIFLFTACGNSEDSTEPVPVVAQTTTVEPKITIPVTPEPVVVEEPVEIEDDFSLPGKGIRPMAVMIDNEGTRVLPQGGLDKAQIVYEIIVEGGLTRLMPVFWGTEPEMIGPVRSARDYFLDYSMEFDAIYVHFGGSPQAGKDIKKYKINEIDGLYLGPDVFWDLTKDRGNWQDSYTSMEKLKAYAQKKKFSETPQAQFPFTYNQKDEALGAGKDASVITLKYPSMTSKYEYDSTTGLYKRFRYGKEHMERVTEKQFTAKNIIVQYVPNYDIKGDSAGRQSMTTTGSGKGYFITGGKVIDLKWSKESRTAQTKYTDDTGNPITLNRGQTWIQIMPMAAKVTIE
ncbi:MAG: DUF3048 domain-containing protein [Clostridiaceae bacterium]|nr:DUF3048 domain-containing protein [Clostridiaceae bacterium]